MELVNGLIEKEFLKAPSRMAILPTVLSIIGMEASTRGIWRKGSSMVQQLSIHSLMVTGSWVPSNATSLHQEPTKMQTERDMKATLITGRWMVKGNCIERAN